MATYGGRFTNLVKTPDAQTQLLVASGGWLEENVFQVVCRWTETCLTKKLLFKFDGTKIDVEESTNSAFPFPRKEEDAIRAEQV